MTLFSGFPAPRLAPLVGAAALALAAGTGAGPAAAATCPVGNVTFTLEQGSPGTATVVECNGPNDTQFARVGGFLDGWTMGEKIEGEGREGDGRVSFLIAPEPGNQIWSVNNPGALSEIILVLKQGPAFGAFRLDTTQTLSGSWSTSGPGNGATNGLSHTTLWYRESCPSGTTATLSVTSTSGSSCGRSGAPSDGPGFATMPLPASGWLSLAAFAVLGLVGWRRRTVTDL